MRIGSLARAAGLALFASFVGACSGGGSGAGTADSVGGDFVVLQTEPNPNGTLFLNDALAIDFSTPVDLSTADLNSVSFVVTDPSGNLLEEQPVGTFSVGRRPGDAEPGRRLLFNPVLPTNNTFTNGGFKPSRRYTVRLIGGAQRNDTILRSTTGRGLEAPYTFTLSTADGTSAQELFRDVRPGGPRRSSFSVAPLDSASGTVPLNKFGTAGVEVRLEFNQPLSPIDSNVPDVSADPLQRSLADRGRIFLQYDDPDPNVGSNRWIPATVDLETNSVQGAVVVLRPVGVLPNNAEIEVIVEPTLQDISGESNVADPSYDRVFGSFRTATAPEPEFDALIETFATAAAVDFEAPILEPLARVQDGRLAASFEFDGSETQLEYEPGSDVILNTVSTVVRPAGAPPQTVTGGVFRFRKVIIPQGITVRGVGDNPMVWQVTESFDVFGTLSVSGSDGEGATGQGIADLPAQGGEGGPNGGRGGDGSPSATTRSLRGEDGFGPGNSVSGGGDGGRLSCLNNCNRGSGGGGGSFATEGDPFYPPVGPQFPIIFGPGHVGCVRSNLATLPGGVAGERPFVDSRLDNNFWGSGVNVFRGVRIEGELALPIGGQGGGGGGDDAGSNCAVNDPAFTADERGGAGGGGGGALIVQCLGKISVAASGRITADGGNGNGGEASAASTAGGGGGGGSGGMVVLMSAVGIDIAAHGGTYGYGENDYDFAISADGGVSLQGVASFRVDGKYTNNQTATTAWTSRSSPGGLGGLGIVQLMAPAGFNEDNTNTRLDDNINFLDTNGDPIVGNRKQQLVGWRGWAVNATEGVDDDGNVFNLGRDEGDIRPSPILLPVPFGSFSRARSRWIDLGSAVRAPVPQVTDARQVQVLAGEDPPSPDFEFDGIGVTRPFGDITGDGYVRFENVGGIAEQEVSVVANAPFESVADDATFLGEPAYLVRAAAPIQPNDPSSFPGGIPEDRFVGYRARLIDGQGDSLGEFRIFGHDDRDVFVEAAGALPSAAVSGIEIVARFVAVSTNGEPNLGQTYFDSASGGDVPLANVRIGFAFSTDPSDPAARWPQDPTLFEHNFDLAGNRDFANWLAANRPSFVQWDVLFNGRFSPDRSANNVNEDLPVTLNLPRQTVDFLVLPYRF